MTIFNEQALAEKHILVTGATGGIGWETAKAVAQMGAKLTVTGRDADKLKQLEDELKGMMDNNQLHVQTADLADANDRKQLVETAEARLGFIGGLVNSAGVAGGKQVEELDQEFLEHLMNINYTSTFMLTQLVYQRMIKQGKGDIVNLASLSGLRGTAGNTAYAASKFAVVGWTQSMALEAIEHCVRVNAVCPGYVDTEMARASIRRKAERKEIPVEQAMEEARSGIPSNRLSTPQEVAQTIAFLLTDAAPNIVGESVKISGGSVMR
ncbi:SDR family oxidoreductase [Planococcus sp. CP5-4]|uniref:SDR family NAD(P)-dependent oxidoreductase n=1 Tax=unclassified Planococcus (in: firmicutes) TaxID=2662419 RepID=UPI001C214156|nr:MULTISPECIES: SDR family oxidoreductase [unclassified Planococcus (in: firmicutes)]MBU9674586.1 SDR family oxidoreductase [Planococcus sp. CP5-4_YE]MBV0910326.1 SDR family oxidoreductase [Planococcus sp. CP5-4_UN]MBW6065177.1 SDR family oxidoreductase [Planococcus sp. CP5-4]